MFYRIGGGKMLSVKGVYDGKRLKLDEKVSIQSPGDAILTFLLPRSSKEEPIDGFIPSFLLLFLFLLFHCNPQCHLLFHVMQ